MVRTLSDCKPNGGRACEIDGDLVPAPHKVVVLTRR